MGDVDSETPPPTLSPTAFWPGKLQFQNILVTPARGWHWERRVTHSP